MGKAVMAGGRGWARRVDRRGWVGRVRPHGASKRVGGVDKSALSGMLPAYPDVRLSEGGVELGGASDQPGARIGVAGFAQEPA